MTEQQTKQPGSAAAPPSPSGAGATGSPGTAAPRPPGGPTKGPINTMWGWIAIVLVAVVGVVVYFVWPVKPKDDVTTCLKMVLGEKMGLLTNQGLVLSTEAIKSGKLDLSGKSSETTEFRKAVSDEVLLKGLEVCRSAYVRGAGVPQDLTQAPREALGVEMVAALVSVQSKRGSLKYPEKGLNVFSTSTKVQPCTTDHNGQCTIVVERMKSSDGVTVKVSQTGVTEQRFTLAELVDGVTLEIPAALPVTTVRVLDCAGQPLAGKVQFDASGIELTRLDCTTGNCREAFLANGEARFRYDPTTVQKFTLHFLPHTGTPQSQEYDKLGDLLAVTYPEPCPIPGRPTSCKAPITSALKNQAIAVAGGTQGSVTFSINNNVVAISAAPEPISRQLNGKRITSENCTGRFQVP